MSVEEIRNICLSFPGVTEDIKWGDHLCFSVGGKMFLVTAPDNSPVSASFKVSDEDFVMFPEKSGFIPAPYMARNKWIFVDNIDRLSENQWEKYLRIGYDIKFADLTLKSQQSILGGVHSSPKKKAAKKTRKPARPKRRAKR